MKPKKFLLLNKTLYLLVLLLFSAVSSMAHGLSGGEFISWDIFGPAGASMGGAMTAGLPGGEATFWNPATNYNIEHSNMFFCHSSMYSDTTIDYFSYSLPRIFSGGLSIGILYKSTDFTWYDLEGAAEDLGIFDTAVFVGYGKSITDKIAGGLNLKGIYQKLDSFTSHGFALDLSLRAGPYFRCIYLGTMLQNIGCRSAFSEVSDPMPLNIRVGASLNFASIKGTGVDLWADAKMDLIDDSTVLEGRFGVQLKLHNSMFVRGGFSRDADRFNTTFGVGVSIGYLKIDYAYLPIDLLGTIHQIALTFIPGMVQKKPELKGPLSEKKKRKVQPRSVPKKKAPAQVVDVEVEPDIEEEVVVHTIICKILYAKDAYILLPAQIQLLESKLALVTAHKSISRIYIDGHTDDLNSAEYNLEHSRKRAKHVKRYFLAHGFHLSVLRVEAFGKERPEKKAENEQARARNRRVVIRILYTGPSKD